MSFHVVSYVRSSRTHPVSISYYSHANASNQPGGRPKVTAVRSLAFGDVNRLLWHSYTVAIAAPSDGPPTSLGVGAGVAGANPNRTLLSLVSLRLSLSLSSLLSFLRSVFYHSILPPRCIFIRTNYRPPAGDTSSRRQSILFLAAAAAAPIGLAFDETKWTNLDLLIALGRVDGANTLRDNWINSWLIRTFDLTILHTTIHCIQNLLIL